jgi:hypothetical protein
VIRHDAQAATRLQLAAVARHHLKRVLVAAAAPVGGAEDFERTCEAMPKT